MTITVPNSLSVGSPIQISLSSSSRKNQLVTVTIVDGEGNSDSVDIQLDGNGNGSEDWTVPGWEVAKFNDEACQEVTRTITQPAEETA